MKIFWTLTIVGIFLLRHSQSSCCVTHRTVIRKSKNWKALSMKYDLIFYLPTIHVIFDVYKNLEPLVFEHKSYIKYNLYWSFNLIKGLW